MSFLVASQVAGFRCYNILHALHLFAHFICRTILLYASELRFGSGLNPLPFFMYPSRLAAVMKFIFFVCSCLLALCDCIYTTYSFCWSRFARVKHKNASRSSRPSVIRWATRVSRIRPTSPLRVEGGGIFAYASAPTRFTRPASSRAFVAIMVCRSSITVLASTIGNI